MLQKSEKLSLSMLLILLNRLKQHKALNLSLVFIYGISLIFLHDFFVGLSYNTMINLSLPVYNKVVLAISVCGGIAVLVSLLYMLYNTKEDRNKKIFFLLTTSLLIALHYKFLFEMNIEVVHVLEFTFLAVLLFPLTGSFGGAVVFTLPFIFVNEWYQYVVLYPTYIHYFEFNDIVVDLLGCGIAMIVLWIAGAKPGGNPVPLLKQPSVISLLIINLLFVVLLATCVFAFYPADKCSTTFLVLNQLPNPHLFWQTHVYGAIYHVMKPVEGMIAINLVCLFFIVMDSMAIKQTL
jgi:hypothetical protein